MRVAAVFGDVVTLKGDLALELRLERARTTKDVDLRVSGSPGGVLATLQEAGRRDLGGFMTCETRLDIDAPAIQNEGMRYDRLRFRAEGKLADRLYVWPFGVDVVFGEPMFGEPDLPVGDDVLASPPSPRRPFGSIRSSLTLPRSSTRTRCRDRGPTPV